MKGSFENTADPKLPDPLLPAIVFVHQFHMQKEYPKWRSVCLNSSGHFSPYKSVLISVKCSVVGLYFVMKSISSPEFHRCRSPFTFHVMCTSEFAFSFGLALDLHWTCPFGWSCFVVSGGDVIRPCRISSQCVAAIGIFKAHCAALSLHVRSICSMHWCLFGCVSWIFLNIWRKLIDMKSLCVSYIVFKAALHAERILLWWVKPIAVRDISSRQRLVKNFVVDPISPMMRSAWRLLLAS